MKLKYDKDIEKIKIGINSCEKNIIKLNELTIEDKDKTIIIIQNRIKKKKKKIKELQALQAPISVSLVI